MKEFKSHSHVICQSTSNLEEGQDFIIRELNLQAKVPSLRERRHSIIDPMDMRDFLDPDKYHRYDNIVRYLKVRFICYLLLARLESFQPNRGKTVLVVVSIPHQPTSSISLLQKNNFYHYKFSPEPCLDIGAGLVCTSDPMFF